MQLQLEAIAAARQGRLVNTRRRHSRVATTYITYSSLLRVIECRLSRVSRFVWIGCQWGPYSKQSNVRPWGTPVIHVFQARTGLANGLTRLCRAYIVTWTTETPKASSSFLGIAGTLIVEGAMTSLDAGGAGQLHPPLLRLVFVHLLMLTSMSIISNLTFLTCPQLTMSSPALELCLLLPRSWSRFVRIRASVGCVC